MRTRLDITNFRGVQQGALEDLAQLSVLVGANNSGKSTALEALWFNASRGDTGVAAQIATRRGWCGLGCVAQLLYDLQTKATVTTMLDGNPVQSTLEIGRAVDVDLADLASQDEDFEQRIQINASCVPGIQSRILLSASGSSSRPVVASPVSHVADPHTFVAIETITRFGQLEDAYSAATSRGREDDLNRVTLSAIHAPCCVVAVVRCSRPSGRSAPVLAPPCLAHGSRSR